LISVSSSAVSTQDLSQLIRGIQQRDHNTLSDVYRKYYPLVFGYIKKHGGLETDAKDVFQESIIVIYNLIQADQFEIKTDFGSFLIGVAKRIWLKKIRRDTIHERFVAYSVPTETTEDHPSDVELEGEMELALIRKHILNLGEECQKVLMMSAEGLSNEEIAEQLGYKSEKIVRTKKYKCKEALIQMIKSDPEFKERAL
jgi:RNA polymerase sigma factor (sigma-70 family)